jgi:methyl-accepting chemotaxis protein
LIEEENSSSSVADNSHAASGVEPGIEDELARCLPHLGNMGVQLQQTAAQIEEAVVDICKNFQGIAARSKATVARTTDFLGQNDTVSSGKHSFESLLEACGATMVKIMTSTAEAGELSRRAVERIEQIEKAAQQISVELRQLDHIATGNKILALNARIEAAHSGAIGAGFAAVAVELASQTAKSRDVVAQVGDLAANLRGLAEFTLDDLRRASTKDQLRAEQARREVDESLRDLHAAHDEMKSMLREMTADGVLLANDISSAVRGLQFQDRTSQRIAHVVEDLGTLHGRLSKHVSAEVAQSVVADEGFSAYTMREERAAAGMLEAEAAGGDVELF